MLAAIHLGPRLLVPNGDGIAALFPALTSLALWIAAVGNEQDPEERRILGLFWLWASCLFANRALRDAGWPHPDVEVGLGLTVPIVFYYAWRVVKAPGSTTLRCAAAALVAIVALAFLWPEDASTSMIIAAGSWVYGLLSCLAIASLFIFRTERTAPHG